MGTWFYALGWKLEQGIIQSKIPQTTPTDLLVNTNQEESASSDTVTTPVVQENVSTPMGPDFAIINIVPESETLPYGVKELSFVVTIKNVGNQAINPMALAANMAPLEVQCQDTVDNSLSMIA